MQFSAKLAGLVLTVGICAGAAGALLPGVMQKKPSAPVDGSRFFVDPSNTAGFPQIKGGDFSLVDHNGNLRTSKSTNGEHQLVFFGYAKCKAICSVALPNIAEAVDLLEGLNAPVTPVLITVDPKRDTVAALRNAVPEIHRKMVGLTGDERSLGEAYKAFHIEKKFLFDHADEGAVYSHSSFIYLLGPDGSFKTLFPPIASPARIAEISAGYVAGDS